MFYKSITGETSVCETNVKTVHLLMHPLQKEKQNLTTKPHSPWLDQKNPITSMLIREGKALRKAQEKREGRCLSNRMLWQELDRLPDPGFNPPHRVLGLLLYILHEDKSQSPGHSSLQKSCPLSGILIELNLPLREDSICRSCLCVENAACPRLATP